MSIKVTEVRHGRYTIKIWPDGDGFSGRAMLGNMPVSPQQRARTAQAVAVEIAKLLDGRRARMALGRGPDDIPTAEEFAEALFTVNDQISDNQTRMLRALFEAEERTLTATQLAAAAGQKSFEYANRFFGGLARLVAEEVGYSPSRRPDGSVRWTTTLALGADTDEDEGNGHFRWRMRTEVVEALSGSARIVLLLPMTTATGKHQ